MSVLDDLGLPNYNLLLVSKDLLIEYRVREREIEKLKRIGTHPAEVRVLRAQLYQWARERREQGMSGLWAIPMPA